jgi:cytochrome c553
MRESSIAALGALAAGVVLSSACDSGPEFGYEPPSTGDAGAAPSPFAPAFPTALIAASPPPPISGGTLLVTHDGHTVVAADPDRDLVYVVDVAARRLVRTVALQAGDEPGRVAEDGAGRVHVALREAGALVTLDPSSGTVLARRAVCPAPRGVAWDETTDTVVVACATGELVTLPSAGGAPTRTVTVERDLRDVMIRKGVVSVSTFRSSEVLRLASDGSVAQRSGLANPQTTAQLGDYEPQVAWRAVVDSAGDTVVVHQLHANAEIPTTELAYYEVGPDSATVYAGITVVAPDGTLVSDQPLWGAVLPVDIAVSADGKRALVATPGNAFIPDLRTVLYVGLGATDGAGNVFVPPLPGTAIAVAFDAAGEALAQTRDPAALWLVYPGSTENLSIPLSAVSRDDAGHDVFHTQTSGFIACASCHPEGGDDGHVWNFGGAIRRTSSLRGTIVGTAPYHWPGDVPDFPALVSTVYTERMGGAKLTEDVEAALQGWVEAIPAPPSPSWVDASSAQRGQALFEGAVAGCSACHSGSKLTNNATLDVGTGGAFQVPPLVGVGWRTPLLHDGCAATLEERFSTCATPEHGSTSGLSAQNLSDLVSYLQTL